MYVGAIRAPALGADITIAGPDIMCIGATGTCEGASGSRTIWVVDLSTDLDMDSDNDDGANVPERTLAEDTIELQAPGKCVPFNNDDDDGNGVEDRFDAPPGGMPQEDDLVPMVIDLQIDDPNSLPAGAAFEFWLEYPDPGLNYLIWIWTTPTLDGGVGPVGDPNDGVIDPGERVSITPNLPVVLWVEGTNLTSPGAVTIDLFIAAADSAPQLPDEDLLCLEDSVVVTVSDTPCTTVDLDTDSDHDGDIDPFDDVVEMDVPGRFVILNEDDDDANGFCDFSEQSPPVVGENDLVRIELSASGHTNADVTLTESGQGQLRFWTTAAQTGEIVPPVIWTIGSIPSALYVEGTGMGEKILTLSAGAATDSVRVFVARLDLDVDSDRNGFIHECADDAGENLWTNGRGAIYAVNFDRDGTATDGEGNPLPDAIEFFDDGTLGQEDFTIDNAADANDITPLVLRTTGVVLPGNVQFLLRAEGGLDDARAIHVFKGIAAGETAIWGGTSETESQVDVTSFVNQATAQWVTFGIEGLFFRNTGTIFPFDGEIDLTLKLHVNGQVAGTDTVRLKVAPWMMLSHAQPSQQVWAADAGAENDETLFTPEAGYHVLNDSGQLQTIPLATANQWLQDHVEIGYYHRPGGPQTHAVFRLPYDPEQYTWPVTELLTQANVGIFQLRGSLEDAEPAPGTVMYSGSYGGNLEIMPPNATHPLGRVVVGSTRSDELWAFLDSQQVQAPFQLDVRWLGVGHIDEVFMFTGTTNQVIVADPELAFTLMETIPVADRGKAVFFAKGAETLAAVVPEDSPDNRILKTGMDMTGTDWKYVRLYEGTSAGQVAWIAARGDGWIKVGPLWKTTSKIVAPIGGDPETVISHYMHTRPPTGPLTFFAGMWPKAGDKFVLVKHEDTPFWYDKVTGAVTPAIITVQEMLADTDFRDLNLIDIKGKIDGIKAELDLKAGGAGTLNFLSVPVLYAGRRKDFATDRWAEAFAPGLANVQPIDGDFLYFPRQFAAPNAAGEDIFESWTRTSLPSARFVDDWNLYHAWGGGVHCASAVKRELPDTLDWWLHIGQ